jgi:hypothetical protein
VRPCGDQPQLPADVARPGTVASPARAAPPAEAASSKAFRFAYVARQVAVKAKYRLWVTTAEKDAITGILATCPGQPIPAR